MITAKNTCRHRKENEMSSGELRPSSPPRRHGQSSCRQHRCHREGLQALCLCTGVVPKSRPAARATTGHHHLNTTVCSATIPPLLLRCFPRDRGENATENVTRPASPARGRVHPKAVKNQPWKSVTRKQNAGLSRVEIKTEKMQ